MNTETSNTNDPMAQNVLRLAEVPQTETSELSTPSSGILANRLLCAVFQGVKINIQKQENF